jgi:hypothetical protein
LTTTRNIRITAGLLLSIALAACTATVSPSEPEPAPAIADGEWFAMVTVGEDESGSMTLGVDLAEMLTGEEAREAAVEDGVIGEDEVLPNDFYIDNPEIVYELLRFTDDREILVLSGNDPGQSLRIEPAHLAELYKGTYTGEPIYGVAPGVPIAMNVSVLDGEITRTAMVYLP